MENLAELLKKYYGYGINDPLSSNEQADSEMGLGQDMGLQNKSLLGSDKKTNNTLSLMGLLGSPEALTGLGLISAGMKGQNIGEAALPSFVEGLKVSSAVRTLTKEQEQQKAIDEFGSQVPEQYKPLFKAFPRETMKLLLTPTKSTISGEALKVAAKLQGLNKNEFNKVFNSLSKVEQDLYNNQILGRQDVLSKLNIDLSESQNQPTQGKKAASNIPTLEEYVSKNKTANPSFSEDFLIQKYKEKYNIQ
jgi:hypothetical protein